MQSCEVAIIGAGPAGSTCARVLSERGLSVLLLDRDQFPREKPCAGWITPAVLQTLKIDPELYRKERLLQEIREFSTGVMYGSELTSAYGETVSYAIRRSEFDHFLLLQASAPTLLGEPVASLERSADGWVVNGNIQARLLIGAGGHNCPVARALGALPGRESAIVAMVAELEMGEEQRQRSPLVPGRVSLSFTRDMNGYGWLLRKGNFVNVGLGHLLNKDVRRQCDDFSRHLKHRGQLDRDISEHFKGHAYLPYRGSGGRRMVGDRALLIGDAAGVSYPESGEGILPAIETALMAAQTVLDASRDYRQEKLAPYCAAVSRRYGGTSRFGGVILPAGVKKLGGTALLSSSWLTRHLVLDRWFLHKAERPLDLESCGTRQPRQR
jgi:menaquinone-9 beta-reductase